MDLSTIRASLGALQNNTDMQRMSGLVLGVVIADLVELLDAHTNNTDQRLETLEKQTAMLQPLVDKHYATCGHCGTYVDKDTPYNCSNCESYFCEGCIGECMPNGRICFMCDAAEKTDGYCHIDECHNPVFVVASITECEKCCNPTCIFHLTQLDTGVSPESDKAIWWCVECVEATQ